MSDDTFGFGASKKPAPAAPPTTIDKLKSIVPTVDTRTEVPLERVDKIADRAGFGSREPAATGRAPATRRRKKVQEQWVAINMRVPVSVATPFQDFCDENRYSYPAGFAELMRRAGILPSK